MKKHDFGAWFLLCGLLFLFAPGVSAMAEETEPLFAFAAQAEEVRPGGSFAVTCTPARGDIGAFVLFASAASAVVIFIYVLTMLAHHKYRQSSDFLPDGFVMPAWQVFDWIAIAFFVLVYVTLFLSADTIGSAIAGLIWLVAFGGYCLLHERFQNRDLKGALQR